ncbi:murein biosynthesis integral membrane protein MurJ [Clostridioides difficile]|uniref:murein biosynthesis integral membrane protein MurJ n=1 Tax=Clostridioides difficile TaxID=1496 RepID=UPI001562D458|nr:murein biosynthesis integral membrane protein MurJ [Clostridioides difficile]MDL5120601.1 murein biosynthesis integral membrane protein MurJ [Clostridioides difficile]
MSKVLQSASILFIATIISKVVGFLRDLVIGYVYGIGVISDSYLMALNIITVAFISLLCVAIQSTYMPIYTDIEGKEGKQKALKFTSNIINIIFIISLIVVVLGWFFTEPLVKLFATGFEGEKLKLTMELTRILLFSVGLVCITYILKAYLEIHDYFLVTGLMPLPYNTSIIIAVLLSKAFGVDFLAYGTVFAFFVQMAFLIPFCYKKGFRYKFNINLFDKNVKQMALAIFPVLIGASAYQINSLVDKNLSSFLVTGSLSALNYAYKLNIFVIGVFVASITTVMYPIFSKLGAQKNLKQLKITLCKSVNGVILITMPISVGAFILSKPIVKLLFERGAFDETATLITAQILSCYAIGMVASGMRDILIRVFYSLQDTKIPMKNSILCVICNILFNLILIQTMKVSGLALGSSLAAIVAVCFLIIKLRKKIGKFNVMSILITLLKTFIASCLMAFIVLKLFAKISLISEFLALAVSVSIGAIAYGIIVLILKVDSTDYIINIVKSKIIK